MTIVYISGPMTGFPELNYPAFFEAEDRLRMLGFEVINPARISQSDTSWEACMKRDIIELIGADAVVLLTGWEQSKGARIEAWLARQLGLKVVRLKTLLNLNGGSTKMRLVLEDESLLELSQEGEYVHAGISLDKVEGDQLWKAGIVTREPVAWFGAQMELKLRENDHKQHWSKTDADYLLRRLKQEYFELEEAIERFKRDPSSENAREVIRESADCGNFAMMLADNVSERSYKQVHRTLDSVRNDNRKQLVAGQ